MIEEANNGLTYDQILANKYAKNSTSAGEDARKEFNLASMTGFGADGSREEKELDFEQVRGDFESNSFVQAVLEHIRVKRTLGDELLSRLRD